jgi:predicted enzyme related to lactoylglutathione lyase
VGQPVAFFEVISPDHERAQTFYSELFSWQVNADPAMGGYGLVDTGAGGEAIGGGIGPGSAPEEYGVRIYIRVDDLDKYLIALNSSAASAWLRQPICPRTTVASPSSPTPMATPSACGRSQADAPL